MVLSLADGIVRVVRPKTSRPRMAALAGGLSAIAGELPFGSNFDAKVVKLHFSYQLQTTVWDGQYYAEINKAWLEVFGCFPFSHMKLYCVDRLASKPLAQFFPLTVSHIKDNEVFFKETSKQFQKFHKERLKKFPKAEKLSDGSFLSMHFGGDGLVTKYLANYDAKHPFIVYVDLTSTLLGRTEITMKTHEIPPFSFYEKFEEFQ